MPTEGLEKAQAALETTLQDLFTEQKDTYHYGEWFEPLYFDLAEFVGRKGKRVRPLMFLLSYRAFGGNLPPDHPGLMRVAASLELLHTFILMHDDVIDRSDTRRGLPTYHKLVEQRISAFEGSDRVGENVAVVMGDIVFAMALRVLNQSGFDPLVRARVMEKFLGYTVDTGVGEIYDILFSVRDIAQLSAGEIERMYHLKTTRYTFEAPCVIGAILAGAEETKVAAIRAVTDPLGLAFQIQNDLSECRFADPLEMSSCTDLLEGKKTLVVRCAYDRLDEVDRSFLQLCLNSARRTESTLVKLRDLILKSGALEVMKQRAEDLFTQAAGEVDSGVFTENESARIHTALRLIRQQARVMV
ncbi:MAG: polyprenyl synthetase family protein [Candidatus Methylacidiphilales bacterium]|nr:polyprenyl synthetase family protein [Candidatus Methylacidiphilales bacterium]